MNTLSPAENKGGVVSSPKAGLFIMLQYLTAGESHGECLTAIIEGIPAGLKLKESDLNKELARRQKGFGRSQRMKMEKDCAKITSGLRKDKTSGSPLTIIIKNKDWRKGTDTLSLTKPRPGHADLAGVIKYRTNDIGDIWERASARETAIRVAVGAVAKKLLSEFNIYVLSYVQEIGWVKTDDLKLDILRIKEIQEKIENSAVRCPHKKVSQEMVKAIKAAKERGDSLGGIFEVIVTNLPPGLGDCMHWEKKLDGRLAQALMSIQGIKGVEVGLGFQSAHLPGSKVHDEIFYKTGEFYRKTNNAGGIEGGMTNGEQIILRAVMKPIPTLKIPLQSVDLITKEPSKATVERTDICVVPAAGIVGEAVVAIEGAYALQE